MANFTTKPFRTTLALLAWLSSGATAQTVSDADGNTYNTVTIGAQIWLKENLRTKKFQGGAAIPTTATPAEDIRTTPIPSVYQWAYNGDVANATAYGLLYTYDAANGTPASMTLAKKICPVGFHIPSRSEWTTLVSFLGGGTTALAKMKEAGNTYWTVSTGNTNSSGFSMRAAGQKWRDGSFSGLKTEAYFWTSDGYFFTGGSTQTVDEKRRGLSVRCVSDSLAESTGIGVPGSGSEGPDFFRASADGQYAVSFTARSIQVFDGAGRPVRNVLASRVVDLSGLPRGVYFAKVSDGVSVSTRKLLLP